jgi:hypothetical protein
MSTAVESKSPINSRNCKPSFIFFGFSSLLKLRQLCFFPIYFSLIQTPYILNTQFRKSSSLCVELGEIEPLRRKKTPNRKTLSRFGDLAARN